MRLNYPLSFTVFCVTYFAFIECLKSNDKGVCSVKISTRRTRTKVITMTKWCGKKRCTAKKNKVEAYVVYQNQTVCCTGWEYNNEKDSCNPLCSTGCIGGKCISPETCFCEPPSTLHENHTHICIHPVCDPPCVNSICVANNNCSCNSNFTIYNTTHCAPQCSIGFEIDSSFICKTKCDQNCKNGKCIGNNKCLCDNGFELKNGTCVAMCDCFNGLCTGLSECQCFPGYKKVNETACEPICNDCDGTCIGPNECLCNEGYTIATDGKCKAVCSIPCVNGYCSAPEECSCNRGLVKDGKNLCVKTCEGCSSANNTESWCKTNKLNCHGIYKCFI